MLAPQAGGTDGEVKHIRILQFVTTLRLAGAEKLATDLSIALREKGHEVIVTAYTDDRDSLARRLRAHDVNVVPIAFPKPGLRALAHAVRDLTRLIQQTNPDIIHAHNPAAGTIALVARALARRRSVPVVTTYHGVRPHRLRLAGRLISGADAVIAVGPSAAVQLRAMLPHEHVVEIRNAVVVERTRETVDVRAEFAVDERVLLVAVGRYVQQKGLSLLIDTAAELRRRGSISRGFRLLIVGHGPLRAELEDHANRLGLRDLVTLTGARPDANDIVGAADALVHSAEWEGLPLVILEAMALGTPIVAMKVPGVDDIVVDRRTGLLVLGRTPQAMADAVEEMLRDEPLRKSVVEAGKALIARDYPLEAMVDQHANLYMTVLAERAARR